MVLENSGRPVTARMKGERFTRWVASASNEQALVAMQQFYGDASQIKAQAPAGRRVLSAGSRFSLSGTSCPDSGRSEEHTSELQSLMRISYAVFCLKKKTQRTKT